MFYLPSFMRDDIQTGFDSGTRGKKLEETKRMYMMALNQVFLSAIK